MVVIVELDNNKSPKRPRGWQKGVPRSKLTLEEQHQRRIATTLQNYYANHEERKEQKRLYYHQNAE